MPDITVPVPGDRTAEFYQFFGLWLGGTLSLPVGSLGSPTEAADTSVAAQAAKPWGDDQQDYADAEALWARYSPNARAMFGLLIDNPGKEFSGDEIAEACSIPNGAHGVAGVLAWPGRHGLKIGRGLPSEWREDPATLQGLYWVPEERAELFKAAREKVEGTD